IEAGKTSTEGLRFAWSEGSNRRRAKEGDASPEVNPEMPAVIIKDELMNVARSGSSASRSGKESPLRQYLADAPRQEVALARSPGRLLPPEQTVRQVERELVRVSGKETDGFYSNFNRRLCRPTVRWLTKTPITPNMVSFAGLGVVLLSGYWFAQGYWVAYVLGSLLYFLSVLVDEIDGMLARLTFRESAFGCWLETFIDYTSYVVLFAGMTIGLYRESGPLWLAAGGILFFGTFTSFFVVSFQRKLATDPDRPNEYLSRVHRRLEADSGNILSRFGRQAEFLIRRGAFGHYVFLFSLLGGLKVLFLICVFGSNLVWTLALSFNRLFRNPVSEMHLSESGQQFSARVQAEGNDT
ncbi:MAG: CDP-alcohol phosphatidyltransferase family protein, partial [Acidobacteriota bacterium]